MSLPFTDSFTGSAGPLGSPNWAQARTGASYDQDGSGAAYSNSLVFGYVRFIGDTLSDGQFIEVGIQSGLTGVDALVSIRVNANGTLNTDSDTRYQFDIGEDYAELWRKEGASEELLDSLGTGASSGDVVKLAHDGAGHVKAFINGIEVMSYTDASPLTGGTAWIASSGTLDGQVFLSYATIGNYQAVTGTGALTSPSSQIAGSGVVHHTGTGALTTAAAASSGAGVLHHTGTGALASSAATADGAGTVNGAPASITGTGALTSPAATSSGTGKRGVFDVGGAVAITGPAATLAGTGTVNGSAQSITGTGALTAPASTSSGDGVLHHTGTGAITSSVATASGDGVLHHTGTGAITSSVATATGVGTINGSAQHITGTGALTAPAATTSGDAVRHLFATGAISIAIPTTSGAGKRMATGTGALVAPAATASGASVRHLTGTGALITAIPRVLGYQVTPDPAATKYVDGTGFDSHGRMLTVPLGIADALPGEANYIMGIPHSATGARYVTRWPGAASVKYIDGFALRSDGVQIINPTTGAAEANAGLPVTSRRELAVSTEYPVRAEGGFGIDADGRVAVSNVGA